MKQTLKIPSIDMLPVPHKDLLLFQEIEEKNSQFNPIFVNSTKLEPNKNEDVIDKPIDNSSKVPTSHIPNTKKKKEESKIRKQIEENSKKTKFEQWEDLLIVRERSIIGNHWAKIAKKLPGRSPASIKNRWYSVLRNKFPTEALIGQKERSETNLCGYSSD